MKPVLLALTAATLGFAVEPCQMLVASQALGDPSFSKTVVLLVDVNRTGSMGLVINRQLRNTPVSRVFATARGAQPISDPIHYGGPVERGGMLALLRDAKVKAACGGIALVNDAKQLDRILDRYPGPAALRIYAGYTGWAKGQLEHEIELGGWRVLPFDEQLVYDAKPAALWERLIASTETQLASADTLNEPVLLRLRIPNHFLVVAQR